MGKVLAFSHPPKVGHWCRIQMDDGDPCWISIGKDTVIIKKSKLGIFGKKIFEKGPIIEIYARLSKLDEMFPKKLTPEDMTSLALKYFTNAALNSSSLDEFKVALDKIFI